MEILFRPALPAEAVAITSLVNTAYRGDTGRRGWTTEADLLDGTRISAETTRALFTDPTCTLLVGEADGHLVACVELRQDGQRLYVGMLTVAPQLQGQGIGTLLIDAAQTHARSLGLQSLVMTVISVRHELIAWYVRLGFRPTGETRRFSFTDESFGIPRMPLEFAVLEKILS